MLRGKGKRSLRSFHTGSFSGIIVPWVVAGPQWHYHRVLGKLQREYAEQYTRQKVIKTEATWHDYPRIRSGCESGLPGERKI